MNLKQAILRYTEGKVDAIGCAPVERFKDAPEEHHPARICRGKDAKRVIVFGNAVPRGMPHSPDYSSICCTGRITRSMNG